MHLLLINVINKKKNQIKKIALKHGARSIKIFGSVARREETKDSDIDFLVEFESDRSLFDLIALKNELEELLNMPVDVVTENSIHHTIRENIKSEVVEM